MTEYVTKSSGEQQAFSSGAVRDVSIGKSRFDLIPPAPLRRLADLYARGADNYGAHNWTKGMPISRFQESMERHLQAWKEGDTEEDHLVALCWNAFAIMHFQGTGWDDQFDWTPTEPPAPTK